MKTANRDAARPPGPVAPHQVAPANHLTLLTATIILVPTMAQS